MGKQRDEKRHIWSNVMLIWPTSYTIIFSGLICCLAGFKTIFCYWPVKTTHRNKHTFYTKVFKQIPHFIAQPYIWWGNFNNSFIRVAVGLQNKTTFYLMKNSCFSFSIEIHLQPIALTTLEAQHATLALWRQRTMC